MKMSREGEPGGLMLALFLRGLSLGLRFGNRVSVKLWKAFGPGIHGILRRSVPKSSRSSGAGEGEIEGNVWRENAEVGRGENRVLDTGRMMDLRAPKTMIFSKL